ncbi:MAG: uroporphyrinogen decarboxylase [Gemmatimonadota bacterium]|jgi:uroporphyrinogen decarboxylase|nr:MAG: uroporphyrinogen decarboxylase [Gemmatimonadota bacterium]
MGRTEFNDRLIRALHREPVDRTPVWFMRQAGRSLPRYREIRARRTFLELVHDPEAAAEVTALPLEYYPVDAAVLFTDLATPFIGAGLEFEIQPSIGPVVDPPLDLPADLDRLRPFDPRQDLSFVLEAVSILRDRLAVPVIGFVGAPFTLCSYLFAGTRAERLEQTKRFMWTEPEAWHRLADFWARHVAEFAVAQAEAGAGAIQVFDSWAGSLSTEDYERQILEHSRTIFRRLEEAGVPSIHFATGNPHHLPLYAAAGGNAIGIDWRVPIDEAWASIGPQRAIQGNLDPALLLAGTGPAVERTREILRRVGGRPGHIFNLGHGLLPQTDPSVIAAVVKAVHEFRPQR